MLTSIEICAGAGGQALGLEHAGFHHTALVEIDKNCCETLRTNRPKWNTLHLDAKHFRSIAENYKGVDLLSGGIPCPPFSIAGKQLGHEDERNLFPTFFELAEIIKPKAIFIENVKGLLSPSFSDYRDWIDVQFAVLGFATKWKLLTSSDYGVPQLRPRVGLVALPFSQIDDFKWPKTQETNKTVGTTLIDLMSENGWEKAQDWANKANKIAPTIVGGSKKHGGPDLGPSRARQAWANLGVEGRTIAAEAPEKNFEGNPRLTVRMVARLQGFPDSWQFPGVKTNAYKQVGNAFPPPVAKAVGVNIAKVLKNAKKAPRRRTRKKVA